MPIPLKIKVVKYLIKLINLQSLVHVIAYHVRRLSLLQLKPQLICLLHRAYCRKEKKRPSHKYTRKTKQSEEKITIKNSHVDSGNRHYSAYISSVALIKDTNNEGRNISA